MNQLLNQFLVEAREFIEELSASLLFLERHPHDAERIALVFRLFHTLKGNSGLFEFQSMTKLLHASEDLLDRIRAGELKLSAEMIDILLNVLDILQIMLDEIEQHAVLQTPPEGTTRLIQQLTAVLTSSHAGGAKAAEFNSTQRGSQSESQLDAAPVVTATSDDRWLPWLARLTDAERDQLFKSAPAELQIIHYQPAADCFFQGDDPLLTMRLTPQLLMLDWQTASVWPSLETADIYQCNLQFFAISAATQAELTQHFLYVAEQVTIQSIATQALHALFKPLCSVTESQGLFANGELSALAPVSSDVTLLAQQILDAQLKLLQHTSSPLSDGHLTSIYQTVLALAKALHHPHYERFAAIPPSQCTAKDVLALFPSMSGSANPGTLNTDESSGMVVRPNENPTGPVLESESEPLLDRRRDDLADKVRVLKVPQEKVDALLELVGELVVAKNALPYLIQSAEALSQSNQLVRELKVYSAQLHRLSEELRDSIMQVRMLPVGTIFQRFPRLVRDVARKLGKEVVLQIEGEDTEADKQIVESLADPLVHILRNSLDHGLESPAERLDAGKTAAGHLYIRAQQMGDRVCIEIEDDGRGIDPIKIKHKAKQQGLIDEQRFQTMSDEEAVNLVFLPGFSTANAVSDLSGRGVGMDVVRSSLEKIGGAVSLTSVVGKQTRLRLTLPLSVTVSRVMLIRVDGQLFGVPMELVSETVRVHQQRLHRVGDQQATILRNTLVPLFTAHRLLHLDAQPQCNAAGELSILVIKNGNEPLGVVVDGFAQSIDVLLKPLEGTLAGLPGFAGTALLGNGSVLLILNIKELMLCQ